MDAKLKRESILHHMAKKVLFEEKRVAVPELRVEVEVETRGEVSRANWMLKADFFELDSIEIEPYYGNIVPDLVCEAYPEGGGHARAPMLIEITVSNTIDEERLARIRARRCLALEIDLSLAGGRVTRDELRRLVIEELATKRWLYHPEAEDNREVLTEQLRARADRRVAVLATPLAKIAEDYLNALVAKLRNDKERELNGETVGSRLGTAADERLADAIDKLAIHGFPEAGASMLTAAHEILDRILSIKSDEGIGYRLASGQAVLNAIKQDRAGDRAYHSLFLIAAKIYQPKFTPVQRTKLDQWRGDVRASIKAGEITYLRPSTFDRLLSALFPEMAMALEKPSAKRDAKQNPHAVSTPSDETRAHSPGMLTYNQPRYDGAFSPPRDLAPDGWWLKGRPLDQWRRQNPLSAASWIEPKAPASEPFKSEPAPPAALVNPYERRKG